MDTTHDHYSSTALTDHGLEYWTTRKFLSEETCDALRRAAIILVPHENFREGVPTVFPTGTTDLFRALKESCPADVTVEIAAEDDEYQEIALHFDVVRLPMIFMEWVVVPVVAAFLADYLTKKLGNRFEKAEVEASLIVEREGTDGRKAFQLDYKGPATAFEKTIQADFAKMFRNDESGEPQEPNDDK